MTDKEKIIAELERRLEKYGQDYQIVTLLDFIKNLPEQEPQALDRAAEENSKEYYCSSLEKHNETGICDGCENVKLAFKAGAKWMAEQGVIEQCEGEYSEELGQILTPWTFRELLKDGDKVIVQIRKAE